MHTHWSHCISEMTLCVICTQPKIKCGIRIRTQANSLEPLDPTMYTFRNEKYKPEKTRIIIISYNFNMIYPIYYLQGCIKFPTIWYSSPKFPSPSPFSPHNLIFFPNRLDILPPLGGEVRNFIHPWLFDEYIRLGPGCVSDLTLR